MTTGWPPGKLQDDSRELSRWLAGRPDARTHAREAVQMIKEEQMTNDNSTGHGASLPIPDLSDSELVVLWISLSKGSAVASLDTIIKFARAIEHGVASHCAHMVALPADKSAAAPEGFVLVPVEPTPKMRKAAADAWLDSDSKLFLNKAGAALRAGIAAGKEPQ